MIMCFNDVRKSSVCKCGMTLNTNIPLDRLLGGPKPGDAMVCVDCGTPHILQADLSLKEMTEDQLKSDQYANVRKVVEEAMISAAMGTIQLPGR